VAHSSDRIVPTTSVEASGHCGGAGLRTLLRMKAILQATLAAALSGVLVGYLLKKKVRDLQSPAA